MPVHTVAGALASRSVRSKHRLFLPSVPKEEVPWRSGRLRRFRPPR